MREFPILLRYIVGIYENMALFWKSANFAQAKTILDYRRLHGKITSLDDLRLSKDFPPEAIRRLEPYVEF